MSPSHKFAHVLPMAILGGLFFMFGFVTWLNGSLIPFLQIACELNHMQAYLVTMAFYISYTIMALPMAVILKRTGLKKGMVLGLVVMAVGALLFIPAAELRTFSVFLAALFVLGTGLTILQTASNPYIVMIGPQESAAVRISIMGTLNKAAGVVAPLVFTAFILTDMTQFDESALALLSSEERLLRLDELSSRLVMPYIGMFGALLFLALFVLFAPLPEPQAEDQGCETQQKTSILHHPRLILGAITLFFYVGIEVIAGDTIGLFGKETGAVNFGELTAYTMSFMVVGYLVGILLIPRFVSQEVALIASATSGVVFSVLLIGADTQSTAIWDAWFWWTGAQSVSDAVLFVALLGLSNALVWPALWPLALQGLPKEHISIGSAIMIMGIAGGAIIPLLYGALADYYANPQFAYWLVIPCYVVILFYAVIGRKAQRWHDLFPFARAHSPQRG